MKKNRRPFYFRFLLIYILIGLIAFLFISTFGYRYVYSILEKQKKSDLQDFGHFYSEQTRSHTNNPLSAFSGQEDAMIQAARASGYELWILRSDGYFILNSNTQSSLQEFKAFDPTDGDKSGAFYGDFYGYFQEPTISVYVPITGNMFTYGYILVHQSAKDLQTRADEITLLLTIASIGMVVFFLLSFLFFRLLFFRPIENISKGAREYSLGNLKYRINAKGTDEISYIANTMDYMASTLESFGEDQRKFIANVSHDFRSPLTSIKGYIEAILDGTIPQPMEGKYLKIVLDETERLNKLTQGLLDLNTLDKSGALLTFSNFDIHHLIKKILATFEKRCTDKGISFELTFPSHDFYVYADLDKINQVLYNLIDNAIKFSNPGSIIFIETYIQHEKAFVSVKDQGIGIPAESLSKIWDRFYKTDTSRGKDKKGTGLGLSITKDIILAHKENIDVISTEGVGTEFVFTLQIGKKTSETEEKKIQSE